MDLSPLKLFPCMFWNNKPPRIQRSPKTTSPKVNKCFFCKQPNCKSELCNKKHNFKATVLGTCQMCYAIEHQFVFEPQEYELYNCMCKDHEAMILAQILQHDQLRPNEL